MDTSRPVIAVTGSSGLIGSALIKRLAPRYHLIGFDRKGPPHPPPEAECISFDLSSEESVREGLQAVKAKHGTHLAAVVHLAAYYSFSEKESPKYDEITVRGTERLLRGLKEFQIEQFIFSSTMLVHAPCALGERITEESPLKGTWGYPKSKIETEKLIHASRGTMSTVILRIAGIYDDQCHSIPLAHHIQRLYEKQLTSHLFPGNMDHGQSFLHNDDLIDLLEQLIERRAQLPPETTLLAGEEKTLSFKELQDAFSHLLHGTGWLTLRVPKWFAQFGSWLQHLFKVGDPFIHPWMIALADDHYALDITRGRTALHWQPKRALGSTIPSWIAALKADPKGWYRENDLTLPSK